MKEKLTYGRYKGDLLRTFKHSDQFVYSFILLSSLISLVASFVLSVDAITLAKDSNASLSCNFNSVISCGTVGSSWQAQAFGFPNAFIGLMFEPVICTFAVIGLCKVKLPKALLLIVNFVYGLAFIFAGWLFYESITEIHALCPYCFLVTLGTGLVFFNFLHINIRDNNFNFSEKAFAKIENVMSYHVDVIVNFIYVFTLLCAVFFNYGTAIFGS